jgi:hypothetical protein
MQLSLQLSKLHGTTSYFDGNIGRVGVKSDTVSLPKNKKVQDSFEFLYHLGYITLSLKKENEEEVNCVT